MFYKKKSYKLNLLILSMQLGLLAYKTLRRGAFHFTNFFNYHNTKNITFTITYNCNSRCIMCDIWRIKDHNGLTMEDIKNILDEYKNLRSITLTGGELFLRDDIIELYKEIKKINNKCKIYISTNGLLTDKILEFLKEIEYLGFPYFLISIDGIKKHNMIRGLNTSFDDTVRTIKEIKNRYPNIDIGIKFTIMSWNYDEILDVYNFCEDNKVKFMPKLIDNLKNYTNMYSYENNDKRFYIGKEKIKIISYQLNVILKKFYKKRQYKDALFIKYILDFLDGDFTLGKDCTLRNYSFFIDPYKEVYICRKYNPLGKTEKINSFLSIKNSLEEPCKRCISSYGYYNGLV